MNELYSAIQKSKDLKDRMKVIGIGAGNTSFEVDFFRKKFEVLFPMFSDEDRSIHKVLGEVMTPHFIGVKINDDGSHEVFYSKTGGFKDSEKFLKLMVKLSGL